MTVDPFAPQGEAPKDTNTKETKNVAADEITQDPNGITATFKGGGGFDVPWLVRRWKTAEEALEDLTDNAAQYAELMERMAKANAHFVEVVGKIQPSAKSGGGGGGKPQQAPPAGAPEAPGPDWVFKSGVSKAGKPWKAWMPPQGSDEKPVWI